MQNISLKLAMDPSSVIVIPGTLSEPMLEIGALMGASGGNGDANAVKLALGQSCSFRPLVRTCSPGVQCR